MKAISGRDIAHLHVRAVHACKHRRGDSSTTYVPISWVFVLCAITYLLGHYSPRPDLSKLPSTKQQQAAPDRLGSPTAAAAATSQPQPSGSSAAAGATVATPTASASGRPNVWGGVAPDPQRLESAGRLGAQQLRAAAAAARKTDGLTEASALQAGLAGPGGTPSALTEQLPNIDAAAAKMIQDTGLARLRPPLQPPGESGEGGYRAVPFQIISWYPRIVLFPAFLDPVRCDHIIHLVEKKLVKSGLSFRPDEKPDPNQQTRTSYGTFVSREEDSDGVLAYLEDKIAAVTMLPVSHGEAFNVLRYSHGGHYDSHMDTFDPKDFGPQPSQRMATVVTYLSDVEEGGETAFKKEGWGGIDKLVTDFTTCDPGDLKVKPRKGDAVLFYSLRPDLTIDERALHGACPVGEGSVKWAAVKWIHEKPFGPETRPVAAAAARRRTQQQGRRGGGHGGWGGDELRAAGAGGHPHLYRRQEAVHR